MVVRWELMRWLTSQAHSSCGKFLALVLITWIWTIGAAKGYLSRTVRENFPQYLWRSPPLCSYCCFPAVGRRRRTTCAARFCIYHLATNWLAARWGWLGLGPVLASWLGEQRRLA